MRRAIVIAIAILAACGGDDDGITGVVDTYTVSGVVQYEDRPQLESAFLGDPVPVPARFVEVHAIDEDSGETLASGRTDANGAYELTFEATGGAAMHILAVPVNMAPERPIAVHNVDPLTGNTRELHGFGGATFAIGLDETSDVLVTVASGEAGAFNIYDVLLDVMDRHPSFGTGQPPPPLKALWQVGSDDGTYYIDVDHEMHLLGEEVDGDEFDDSVIAHESGHYIEDVIGRSDSPGGDHAGEPVDPRLAWSEGFATYFALVITDTPLYIDTARDGGFTYDGEGSVTRAMPAGPIGQLVSEDTVTEILYDLGDAPGTDDDPHAGDHNLVFTVEAFLRTATLRDVGSPGVDLIDALDGWFVQNGLGSCASVRTIVVTAHGFPYDFGGAAGVCP